jgi:hypothetical protein
MSDCTETIVDLHKSGSEDDHESNLMWALHVQPAHDLESRHKDDQVSQDVDNGHCTESIGEIATLRGDHGDIPGALDGLAYDEAQEGCVEPPDGGGNDGNPAGYAEPGDGDGKDAAKEEDDAHLDREKGGRVKDLGSEEGFLEVRKVKGRVEDEDVVATAAQGDAEDEADGDGVEEGLSSEVEVVLGVEGGTDDLAGEAAHDGPRRRQDYHDGCCDDETDAVGR